MLWEWFYAAALLLGAAISTLIGVWVSRQPDVDNRRLFVLYMAGNTIWALAAVPWVFVDIESIQLGSIYLTRTAGYVTTLLFTQFAFVYTNHDTSLDNPVYAGVVGGFVLSVLLTLGHPIHGLYAAEISPDPSPFWHLAVTPGPGRQFAAIWSFAVIGVSVYYFLELFLRSRHRSSVSVLLIILAMCGGSVPSILSELGYLPATGFDHAPMGIVLFIVPASYAIFNLGMLDIPPIARDKLVDQLADPILVVDDEHTVVDYTAACGSLDSGFEQRDPVGESLEAVVPPVSESLTFPETADSTHREQLTMQDGSQEIHYSVLISPLVEQESIVGYSVLLQDVTELETYKRELEHRNEQLDQFANAVSHDLRNPLSVANGYTEILESTIAKFESDTPPEPDTLRDHLSQIEQSHERMAAIIDDLRTMAKYGDTAEDIEPVALEAAVEHAWNNVALPEASIEVVEPGTVYAEHNPLLSILENLFRNAVDHGPEDVQLAVGLTDDGFFIADDGPGIPADEADQVFEYGYTTHEDGTGFGLSIVKMMTDAHGWSVSVDPEYDAGARFVFSGVSVEAQPESVSETVPQTE